MHLGQRGRRWYCLLESPIRWGWQLGHWIAWKVMGLVLRLLLSLYAKWPWVFALWILPVLLWHACHPSWPTDCLKRGSLSTWLDIELCTLACAFSNLRSLRLCILLLHQQNLGGVAQSLVHEWLFCDKGSAGWCGTRHVSSIGVVIPTDRWRR